MTATLVYLDHAAATPLDPAVLAAMQPFFSQEFYNPSAVYLRAKAVSGRLADARAQVAAQVGARPSEIIFTAGGTEANNLAIHGVLQRFPDGNIVVSAGEHDSVLRPAEQYDCRRLGLDAHGQVVVQHLRDHIDDKTVLVSVMYANNETGAIQPITQIARHIKEVHQQRLAAGNTRPLYFHTDACQAANYLTLTKSRLGVDLMTLNGGKVYGPKQSGCLFVAAHVELRPQVLGGGQERGFRSGTENVAQVVGFAHALEQAQRLREQETARLHELQVYACQQLYRHVPQVVITGSLQEQTPPEEVTLVIAKHPASLVESRGPVLPNFLHVRVPGTDNERLIMELDERGIMAAAGSACSASNDEPSHVLMAMGLSEADAQTSLRFTMGRSTTKAHIDKLTKVLSALVV